MEEIQLQYYIPRNEEELERLTGKVVGLMMNGGPIDMESVRTYNGIIEGEHEFIAQETNYDAETERSYKKNRISGWRISKDDLEFMVDGVNFHSSNLRCFTYKEDNKEYRRLLKILKENGEWEDIR